MTETTQLPKLEIMPTRRTYSQSNVLSRTSPNYFRRGSITSRTTFTEREKSVLGNTRKYYYNGIDYDRPPVHFQMSPVVSSHREYSIYPPYLRDGSEIVPRVNPARPPGFSRITSSLETVDGHWHNEQRRQLLERRNFHRFHQAWSAYYYGSPGEREAHNGAIRETLKQQIDDRDTARVYDFHTRISESIEVGERDRADVESDSARVAEHKRRLLEYRDANKRMIEEAAERRKDQRRGALEWEREILKYNPINWSHSLK